VQQAQEFWEGFNYFLYILFFFLGSFFSGFSIEIVSKVSDRYIYRLPVIVESVILIMIAVFGNVIIGISPNIIAYALLFAMGLQNSLVTSISNSVVRTTHLTGLFTDLGIELSQLFFYKEQNKRSRLFSSIRLRLTIICFFFLGGVIGGILYPKIHLYELLIVAILLLMGLIYDNIKIKLMWKLHHHKTDK